MLTPKSKYFFLFVLVWIASFNAKAQSDKGVRLTQQFSYVYYQYPIQFLRNGVKFGIDLNMNERFVLGIESQSSYTYYPLFYDEPHNGGGGINVITTPNFLADNNFKLTFKNYIGEYSSSFHGKYVGVYILNGIYRESFFSQLAKGFGTNLREHKDKYTRIGFVFGQQKTLFNQGVIDAYCGLGYNKANTEDRHFTPVTPFNILDNSAYFVAGLGIGIGNPAIDQTLPKRPRLRDSLVLDHAMLLDFNAILNSGIEFNLYHHNFKKHLWRNYVRFRDNRVTAIDITQVDSLRSLMVGVQYRHYLMADQFRNGTYIGFGYSYEHSVAYVSSSETVDFVTTKTTDKIYYDPHNLDVTVGFTTILAHRYILDGYVSNILTLSKGRGGVTYPRINDATGFRTELGFKFGAAKFKRRWN